MDDRTLWAIILIGLAIILFFLEIFLPTGGVIGLLAACSLLGGIVMLFWINTTLGLVAAIVCIIALPFALGAMMKLWPNTPLFRLLALRNPEDEDEEHEDDPARAGADRPASKRNAPQVSPFKPGDRGIAQTPLRPVGICRIDGLRIECIADGDLIDPGTPVQVIHVDGLQVKVRADPLQTD